jgi:phosphatidate cytidylyltransferase
MKERIITGVIAGFVFISLAIIGGIAFSIFIGLIAVIGLKELLAMRKISIFSLFGVLTTLLLVCFMFGNEYLTFFVFDINKLTVVIIGLLALLFVTVVSKNKLSFDDAGFGLLGFIYIGYGFYSFLAVRSLEDGLPLLFFVLFLIWTTDSGAYFVGKAIGKRKLWPHISPNKTIEGSIGGIFAAFGVAVIFQLIYPLFDSLLYALFIALFVGVFGQIGDLVESALKRHYQVKDSGQILPGHGGILDRFDSLLFVFALLYVLELL